MQSNSNLFFLNLQDEYDWGFQSSASSLHSHEVQLLHLHHPSSLEFTPNDHLLLQQILHSFHHEDLVLHSSSQPLETDQNSENQIIVTDEASDKTEPKSYKKQKNMRLNSPFHNYQKHLNTALRKIMVVPDMFQCSDYRQAAFELWTQFKVSKIKNKKILHFIFNQTNTYTISQCELKNYGFYNVYLKYGMNTLNLAKKYLSKLTIEQLDDITISECVNAGKITNRESFKEYMTTFRAELEEGQLKRRIKK